jgi:outer membrane protein assembly factor BamB
MFRFLALIGCLTLLTAAPAQARTDGGDLLWQDEFDLAAGRDGATSVAADSSRVVALGFAQNSAGFFDLTVRAYDAQTGALLWKDRVDLPNGNMSADAVVMEGQRVLVSGNSVDATGHNEAIVRAYVARTGVLAWEDRWSGVARGLAVLGNRVVVGGHIVDAGVSHSLVRAYAANDGIVIWEDRPLPPPGSTDESGFGVTLHGKKAFVTAGVVLAPSSSEGATACSVRAYDLTDGDLLWQSLDVIGGRCAPTGIATDGRAVVLSAAGGPGGDEFDAISFDARTGAFLWRDRSSGTPFFQLAMSVDVEHHVAFVIGWIITEVPPPQTRFQESLLLKAYDTTTGELRWEDRFLLPEGCFCHGFDVVADKGRVFAFGKTAFRVAETWLVRAYDAKSGDLLWNDEFLPAAGASTGFGAIAADGGRVFVASSAWSASGNTDFVVRAYDAK